MTGDERPDHRIRRRDLFVAGGAGAVAGLAGWGAHAVADRAEPAEADPTPTPAPVGIRRAGITAPAVPQRHALLTVYDLAGRSDDEVLAAAREAEASAPAVPPDAGEVTVTVGFGLGRARALWPSDAGPTTCRRSTTTTPMS